MSWTKKAFATIDFKWNITDKGLVLTVDPKEQARMQEEFGDVLDSDDFMYDYLEGMIANSDLEWVRPEEIGALTSAPILGIVDRDDRGELTGVDSIFWFPNYQIESPMRTLAETGTVTFDAAPEEKKASIKIGANLSKVAARPGKTTPQQDIEMLFNVMGPGGAIQLIYSRPSEMTGRTDRDKELLQKIVGFDTFLEQDYDKVLDKVGKAGYSLETELPPENDVTASKGVSKMSEGVKVKAQEIGEDQAGPWVQNAGVMTGAKIQEIAQKMGWEGAVITDPEDEAYFQATYDAQNYLQSLAPIGYRFDMTEEGDWGLWKIPSGEEEMGEFALPEEVIPEMGPMPASLRRHVIPIRKFMARYAAQPDRDPTEEEKRVATEENGVLVWDDTSKTYYVRHTAAKLAFATLNRVTIASEFKDELWPRKEGLPVRGSRVLVKATSEFGTVLGCKNGGYEVQTQVADSVNPGQKREVVNLLWGTEIELR